MRIAAWRMGFAGDVLFSTAALEGIKKKYPRSKLTYGVWPTYYNVIETNPHVDVWCHDDTTLGWAKKRADKTWEISHEVYKLEFGEMHYWGKIHAMQAADLGLLNLDDMESFKPQVYLSSSDVIQKPAGTKVAALGVFSKNGADARLWAMRQGTWSVSNSKARALAMAAIGAKWEFDRQGWPALVEALGKMGFQCVQLGGPDDPRVPGAHDLCGKLTWRQSVGVVMQADVCITIDSFLLHASVARKYGLDGAVLSEGTPTVALLGPTDGRGMFPVDAEGAVEVHKRFPRYVEEKCCPCFNSSRFGKGPCKHDNLCMRSITVEDVLAGVEKATKER